MNEIVIFENAHGSRGLSVSTYNPPPFGTPAAAAAAFTLQVRLIHSSVPMPFVRLYSPDDHGLIQSFVCFIRRSTRKSERLK